VSGAEWKSNHQRFLRAHVNAVDDGLIAASQVIVNEVKRMLRGGFKGGAFTTGQLLNSVTRSAPFNYRGGNRTGVRSVRVGTPLLYGLGWELGHHNVYTRAFEREERWRPAMAQAREAAAKAFAIAYMNRMRREMGR
jgi:hypothetical protein